MRFSQLFLRIVQGTIVEVYKCKDGSVKGEFVDSFKKYDKVPREIWSGFVCSVWPVDLNTIGAIVEDCKDECKN